MARPRKKGVDYFPFDIDFFQDMKIRKLVKYQGGKAVAVYALLLCIIYKEGYYMRWDEELPFVISENTGFDEAYIQEVIKSCLNIGLFNSDLYRNHGVLTSRGIQERYRKICQMSRLTASITDFSLVSSEETPISSEETPVSSEETPVSSETMPQIKINKKKKKKISTDVDTKENPTPTPTSSPVDLENFSPGLRQEIEALEADRQWIDALCANHRLETAAVMVLIKEFENFCRSDGKECHQSLADAKNHFNRWLIKRRAAEASQPPRENQGARRAASEQEQRQRSEEYHRRKQNAVRFEDYARNIGHEGASLNEILNMSITKPT